MWEAAAAGAAMGVVGGLMDSGETRQSVTVGSSSPLGHESGKTLRDLLEELEKMNKAGAGAKDVSKATDSQRAFADLLGKYAKGGFLPTSSDISTANSQANALFGGQRAAMQNSFIGQTQQANQLASRLGRSTNDPILQAQLRGQMFQQENLLAGQQGAMAQDLAMQMPMQRLQFASSQNDVLSQLASQAFQNRQALAGIGTNIRAMENNVRVAGASTVTQQGGSFQQAMTSGMAGFGIGAKAGSYMNKSPQG
jgi:hypothetical protein